MWQLQVVTFKTQDVDALKETVEEALDLLDVDVRARLLKYYRKEDTFRGLIGRLFPCVLLKDQGISPASMTFRTTSAGKPYISMQELREDMGYSITHDHGAVAMAFASGDDLHPDPPAHKVGVDVMRLNLPKRHDFRCFVEVFTEQLTEEELAILLPLPGLPQEEGLRRFYLIWTLKEAFSKSLGIGLGFNFKRISYDVINDTVRVDGVVPEDWEFTRFGLMVDDPSGAESYVGVAVRYNPGKVERPGRVIHAEQPSEWLKMFDAGDFLQRAILALDVK